METIRYLRIENIKLDAEDIKELKNFPPEGKRKGWVDPERGLFIFDPYYSITHEIEAYLVHYYYYKNGKSFYTFYDTQEEAQKVINEIVKDRFC